MAGSHRNNEVEVRTWNLPLIGLVVLGVIGAFVTVWGVVLLTGENEGALPDPAATPPSPSVTISIDASPDASASADPSSSESDSADVPPAEAAPPRRLVIDGVVDSGFDNAVTGDDPLEAGSSNRLSRLESRGLPGSPGTDTVVVVGEDRFDRNAVLNDIADATVGQTIRLETGEATLIYTIDEILELSSDEVQQHPSVAEEDGTRLVLVATTFDDQGERTGTDSVVVATLSDVDES